MIPNRPGVRDTIPTTTCAAATTRGARGDRFARAHLERGLVVASKEFSA
jgi:hypothetical protein